MFSFMFFRRSTFAVAVLAAASFVAGCSSRGSVGNANQGHTPGVLRYAISNEPTTLDPALVSDGWTVDLLMQVYEGLVGWGPNNQILPMVAEKLPTLSPDGRTYTFTIRPNVTFTNGRAVGADDIKYSLTRALDPKLNSPVAMTYLNDIVGAQALFDGKTNELTGVKVLDARTVQITIDKPRAYFLGKLTYPTGYVLAREEIEKGPTTENGGRTIDATNSVGTGPFVMASYTPQQKVVLDANTRYWNNKPKLDRIERPIVLSAQTRRNLYDTGDLDLIEITKGEYERDRDNSGLQKETKQWNRAAVYYLGLNQTHYAPFRDKRVRQAVAHAVDKDAILKNVLLDVPPKAEGVVPIGVPGHDPTLRGLPFDPQKAKQLLAQAGFPGGKGLPPLTLTFREQWPDLSKTAQVVQQQLAAVGITIQLNEMEWGAFLKATDNKEVDFLHMRWSADYLDPQNFLSVLLHSKAPENRVAYSNPDYDALLEQADAESDPDKRTALYRRAERIVVEEAPWVPLYYQRDIELIKPYVKNLRDSLMGHLPHTTTVVE